MTYRPRRPTRRQVAQALALIEPRKREETSVAEQEPTAATSKWVRLRDGAYWHLTTEASKLGTYPRIYADEQPSFDTACPECWMQNDRQEHALIASQLEPGEIWVAEPTPRPPAGERGE